MGPSWGALLQSTGHDSRITDPFKHEPIWASDTAAFPTLHAWTANMHLLRYVRLSVPQTRSFSDGHLIWWWENEMEMAATNSESRARSPVVALRALRSLTALGIFLDRIYVAFSTRLFLQFAGIRIDDAICTTYWLLLCGWRRAWARTIWWYGSCFSIAQVIFI